MDYELAKRLNSRVCFKTCKDCKVTYLGGYKSFRCKPCQATFRRYSNSAWQKTYYEKNRERILKRHVERQNIRRNTDPLFRESERTKYHKRRSLIEGNGGCHTTKEWLDLVSKCENKCVKCSEEKKLTRDHIIPISKGGTNDISNIQPLCGSCNSSKGNKYEI